MKLGSIVHVPTAKKPWKAPPIELPIIVSESELRPLETVHGRQWYAHARYGELCARPAHLSDSDTLPNRLLMVQHDSEGAREYVVLDAFAPGTLEASKTAPAARWGPQPPKRAKPVDLLNGIGRRPELVMPTGERGILPPLTPTGTLVRGHAAVSGQDELTRFVRSKGVILALTPAGKVWATAPGGRMHGDALRALNEGHRLIAATLAGMTIPCEAPHKDTPPPAVTIVVPDLAVCRDHAEGRA